ncbi:hypothetical protein GCM10010276_08310 [Streptomyces longisporus]|uniref:Uncharacterized protein n=1 Tax=Streptomyces longisporus TaxID=1948 RepID=A0ABP5YB59_STRLO
MSAPRRPFPIGRPCWIIEVGEPGARHHSWFLAAAAADNKGEEEGRRGAAEAVKAGRPPRAATAPAVEAKVRKRLRLGWSSDGSGC